MDFERDPPAGHASYGKLYIELWDCSGDTKYEKTWPAIKKDVDGIIFVYDPSQNGHDEHLNFLVNNFPKEMKILPRYCMCMVNHFNTGGPGSQLPQHTLPASMKGLHVYEGTCEDGHGIQGSFEVYLNKLMKLLIEKQKNQEKDLLE